MNNSTQCQMTRATKGTLGANILSALKSKTYAERMLLSDLTKLTNSSSEGSVYVTAKVLVKSGQIASKKIRNKTHYWDAAYPDEDSVDTNTKEITHVLKDAIPTEPIEKAVIGLNENGEAIEIDIAKLIQTRMLVQAASGGGKSYALRRLLEQTHSSIQQIIIDPEGEFKTMTEKLPYLVCARSGGDIEINFSSGKLLADEVMKRKISVIIDISDFGPESRGVFVASFIAQLMRQPQERWSHAMVVIDECHLFVPQQDKSPAKKPIIDLAARGRKRGLCAVLATQRISKLNKSVAAELLNRMVGMTYLDIDIKRSADEMGISNSMASEMLPELKTGEFYAFGPAISHKLKKLKVGAVQTSHGALSTEVSRPTILTDEMKLDMKSTFNDMLMKDRQSMAEELLSMATDRDELEDELSDEMWMWELRDQLELDIYKLSMKGMLSRPTPAQLDAAIKRYAMAFDDNQDGKDQALMSMYRKKYRIAEEKYKNGMLGLVPDLHISRDFGLKVCEKSIELMIEVIEDSKIRIPPSIEDTDELYLRLKERCKQEGIKPPTKGSLMTAIFRHFNYSVES